MVSAAMLLMLILAAGVSQGIQEVFERNLQLGENALESAL